MVGPEQLPLAVEVGRTQVEHRLRSVRNPTHPCTLQTVLHQVPTPPLHHTTADRVSRHQVFIVLHPLPVPHEVTHRFVHCRAPRPLQLPLGHHLTQPTDDKCQWTRIVTRLVNPNCYEA